MEEGQEGTPITDPTDVNAFLSAFKYRPTIGALMSDPDAMEQAFKTQLVKEIKGGVMLAFDALDLDKSGTIDLAELKALLKKLGHEEAPDQMLQTVRRR